MSKCIYIIRNKVNNMAYVGQTKDMKGRWWGHLSSARTGFNEMPLYDAMREIGIDKFYYQILEDDVKDELSDDREQYWIKQMNTLHPHGYNICVGGKGVGFGVDNPVADLNQYQLNKLVEDLMYSGLSNEKLADKHGCGCWTVWAVNNGKAYYNPNLKYPLKKSNRYTKEKIKQVKYALKYELDKSIADISREFKMDMSQVNDINQGKIYNFSNEVYPLRAGKHKNVLSVDTVDSIVYDLLNTTMQQKEIARKYNVSANCISGINKGISYFNPNLNYPLRNNYQSNACHIKTLTLQEVSEVEDLLQHSNLSMRKIAEEYECTLTVIQNINNGSILKYKNPNKKYPLRDKRYHLIHQPVSTIPE